MSEHSAAHPTARTFVTVWLGLVALTGIEVWLAYIHLNLTLMLGLLVSLSIVKAAMIMSYFMHLRYERLTLSLWLIPSLVVCICLMSIFFPDAARALNLRV